MKDVEITFENKDKTIISKKVPQNLVELYKIQGWKLATDKARKPKEIEPQENKPKFSYRDTNNE